ncbi:hypothetical protein [Priestia taiwanensis]|uniref:Swarming motility protein SwrB n=1 Tax=Priestia taiwanensis TaxID=1347902 RepID=A0A917ART2_9BACI|nr:hypothetical protein [Priestia taiwanensis]MBM7362816.1 hypothetical protein [Priestia taiwanensis]GGE65346.1 swarming motility protein SwrB [Priestia taiwanensis]
MFYLLIIGIVTQVIMLLWITVLHKRLNQLQDVKKDNEKIQRETEDILMSFIAEMKEENEKFLKKVKSTSTIEYKEQKQEILTEYERSIDVKEEQVAYKEFLPPFSEEDRSSNEEVVETKEAPLLLDDIAEKAERLAQEGYKIEEIAKQLNKGKTEIELLMKFRQSYTK